MEKNKVGNVRRNKEMPRYDLIPKEALDALADRFAIGEEKYGAYNYLNGIGNAIFIRDCMNHIIAHAMAFTARDYSEDSPYEALGAIMCNAAIALVCADLKKETK